MCFTNERPHWPRVCFRLIKRFNGKPLHGHLAAHLYTCIEVDEKGVHGKGFLGLGGPLSAVRTQSDYLGVWPY